ncbi:MAG: hypothetical protein IIC49_00320, partial [Planctomycetes bacterium]|nr:hypothetical protein [Planctomycetota bacterium]
SLVVLGSLMLLISVAVLVAQAAGVNWDRHKPFAMLSAELRHMVGRQDAARADELLGEILDRVSTDRLDAARLQPLVLRALEIQADPDAAWSLSWGDLIETYDAEVGLGDEHLAAYLNVGSRETIHVRPLVRLGDRLPIEFRHDRVRLGPGRRTGLRTRVAGGSIAGRPLPVNHPGMGLRAVVGGLGSGSSRISIDMGDLDLAPGRYPLTLDIEFELLDGVDPNARSLSTWTETVETTIDLVPRDDHDIKLIAPNGSDPINGRVEVMKLEVIRNERGNLELVGTLLLGRVQVPCSFEITTIVDGRSVSLGAVAYSPPADPSRLGIHGFSMRAELPRDFSARTLDITLTPHPNPARYTVRITEIWGGEIVIEDVPITYPDK